MTEDEAQNWIVGNVSRETLDRLKIFLDLLRAENEHQNLVSRASLDSFWARHAVDSLQLLSLAPPTGPWVDLGTGAGFPGMAIAAARKDMVLVEARRLRVDFLERVAEAMGVTGHVSIRHGKAESVPALAAATISARAFAPLDMTFAIGARFATPNTLWLLPKGRSAQSELEAARASWQGEFRLVPSITDAEAMILIARDVRPAGKGRKR